MQHYKGVYRLKTPIDLDTKNFPREYTGQFADNDIYIDCQHNIQISSWGRGILEAYVPSLIRGHNILKAIVGLEKFNTIYSGINENTPQYIGENGQKTAIKEQFHGDIIFDIEETDSEVLFKFKANYMTDLEKYLKPKTSGANISPFSTRNLAKNKTYKIPDEELEQYKQIIAKIPKKHILSLTHTTNNYLKTLVSKKNTWEDIKADMVLKGLKGKEYIHSLDKWNDYIKYLNDNSNFEEVKNE